VGFDGVEEFGAEAGALVGGVDGELSKTHDIRSGVPGGLGIWVGVVEGDGADDVVVVDGDEGLGGVCGEAVVCGGLVLVGGEVAHALLCEWFVGSVEHGRDLGEVVFGVVWADVDGALGCVGWHVGW